MKTRDEMVAEGMKAPAVAGAIKSVSPDCPPGAFLVCSIRASYRGRADNGDGSGFENGFRDSRGAFPSGERRPIF